MSLEELKKLGVGFSTEYKDGTKISNIELPLTPVQWWNLCTRDGNHYVGGCCGQTGYLQDMLNGWFRDGGWASGKDWWEFCTGMAAHDDGKGFTTEYIQNVGWKEASKQITKNWACEDLNVWGKLALIWKLSKDHLSLERVPRHGYKPGKLEDAIQVLSRCSMSMSWEKVFGDHPAKKEEPDTQNHVGRTMMLYRLYPALKTLTDKIGDLNPGPVDGHAIWIHDRDEIATNGFGFCVYGTEDEAREMIDAWKKDPDSEDDMKDYEALKVRPVRVTVEDGLVYTD